MSKVSPCRFGAKSYLKMDSPSSQKGASFLESLLSALSYPPCFAIERRGALGPAAILTGSCFAWLEKLFSTIFKRRMCFMNSLSFHQTLDVVDVQLLHQIIQTDLWDKKKWRGDGLNGKFGFRIQLTWCDRYSCISSRGAVGCEGQRILSTEGLFKRLCLTFKRLFASHLKNVAVIVCKW